MNHVTCIQHCENGHNNGKTEAAMRSRAGKFGFVFISHDLNHYLYRHSASHAKMAARELMEKFWQGSASETEEKVFVDGSKTFMAAWADELMKRKMEDGL